MYNVYKHQGSETAQYGLEIIFNRCPRYIVYSTFLLTQKQNASSSPALPNLWLYLVYHFTSNTCLANFKVFLCFIMLFVFFFVQNTVLLLGRATHIFTRNCVSAQEEDQRSLLNILLSLAYVTQRVCSN